MKEDVGQQEEAEFGHCLTFVSASSCYQSVACSYEVMLRDIMELIVVLHYDFLY